jgi:hypothetical protein
LTVDCDTQDIADAEVALAHTTKHLQRYQQLPPDLIAARRMVAAASDELAALQAEFKTIVA